ncbi:MAG: hypothetical protein PHG63_01585 [Candidatus Dojkabacteria bacterium]|nr:hypothetical protein [Candidatus Dojkabacteria bacterium]
MASQLPKSLNLLQPTETPVSSWDRIYLWVFSIGRYLIIAVELIVLIAFAARFSLDRRNNDLKESIAVKVELLKEQKDTEAELRRVQSTLSNFSYMLDQQEKLSSDLSEILDDIPSEIDVSIFSISQLSISFSGTAPSYEIMAELEKDLRENPAYSNVKVELTKPGGVESSVEYVIQISTEQEDTNGGR